MNQRIEDFLLGSGMHVDSIDMDTAVQHYREEMCRGLRGERSSLPMMPTYIGLHRELPSHHDVLMIDAGGTNLRLAIARLGDEGFVMREFSAYPMLGMQNALTLSEFFERMADYIQPYIERFRLDTVGFCFSFYVEIQPNRDALVKEFNKEINISIEGDAMLGKGICAALKRRGCRPLKFVILNDTVAALLGGYLSNTTEAYESYIGFILGTGTNLCYLEQVQNIAKRSGATSDMREMIINCESGMYNGFVQGVYDRALDEGSLEPGLCKLEKMVSGVYQGDLIYRTAQGAAEQGLFSAEFAERLAVPTTFSMQGIDAFCNAPSAPGILAKLVGNDQQDMESLLRIIAISQQRAACITAVAFTATLLQAGLGNDPNRPVCVTGEGSGFQKSRMFRQKLGEYHTKYLYKRWGLHVRFVDGENTTFVGAAAAALMWGG